MTTFDEKDTTFDKTLEKDTTIDKTLILDSFSITYGEETQLPLSIQEADIAFEAVPSQQLASTTVTITVVNDIVERDIEAALRFRLPNDATVCGFQLDENEAIAVPKAKAAEVAYKEREKGRAVATTAAVQGAVFETTIFPLPFGVPKQLVLIVHTNLSADPSGTFSMHLPLAFAKPVPVVLHARAQDGEATLVADGQTYTSSSLCRHAFPPPSTTLADGVRLVVTKAYGASEVVSGIVDDDVYYGGCVSRERLDRALNTSGDMLVSVKSAAHIGLFIDTSGSGAKAEDILALLDALDNAYAELPTFSVWTFSRVVKRRTSHATLAETKAAVAALRWGGGTDLTCIDLLVAEAAKDDTPCDTALLLTDGIDNLKANPALTGPGVGAFPVHIPMPAPTANANLSVLRWLATQLGGTATVPLSDPAGVAALLSGTAPPLLLTKLETSRQDDLDAFEDDTFETCPDFRLSRVAVAPDSDGSLRVSGKCRLGDGAPPTALYLHVCRGGQRATLELRIPPPTAGLGRLLDVNHALLSVTQLKNAHWNPAEVSKCATELTCSAGIASEYSSLLLLSLPEQFADNGLTCPADHPAHQAWMALRAERERSQAEREAAAARTKANKLDGMISGLANRYKDLAQQRVQSWGKRIGEGEYGGDRARPRSAAAAGRGMAYRGGINLATDPAVAAVSAMAYRASAPSALAHMDVEESLAAPLHGSDIMPSDGALMATDEEDTPCCFRSLGAEAQSARSLGAAPCFLGLSAEPPMDHASAPPPAPCFRGLSAEPPSMDHASAPPPAPPAYAPTYPSPSLSLKVPLKVAEADDPWLQPIRTAYATSRLDGALAAFDAQLREQPSLQGVPSTYILACELLHSCGAPSDACADVLFNVLEVSLADFRTCRVVAYHLLALDRFDEAVKLLELVVELAPAEPHSHTDIAFARLLRLRRCAAVASPELDHAASEMRQVVESLTKVLVDTDWPKRFAEIEWPCLILLSWAVAWAEATWPSLRGTMWPEAQLPSAKFRLGDEAGPQLDVFVWLGWDTDHTDVDLHVKEPTGEEVYYSNNRSRTTGATVSRDFTQGFGPEVYTLPSAPAGTYKVETNFYANNQGTAVTGSTSAVIWSIEKMGHFGEERMEFSSVRLTRHKQRQQVLALEVSNQKKSDA